VFGSRHRDRLDGLGSILGSARFSLLHSIQTGYGPTQSLIQWVPGPLSPGVKRQGLKLTGHLHRVPRSKKMELHIPSLICLHGLTNYAQGQLYVLPSVHVFITHLLSYSIKQWIGCSGHTKVFVFLARNKLHSHTYCKEQITIFYCKDHVKMRDTRTHNIGKRKSWVSKFLIYF
jgi:hypothetical protein